MSRASIDTPIEIVVGEMRDLLGFDLATRRSCSTWTDALRLFVRQADDAGVIMMVSWVLASNNRRHLDPTEFRGFCLSRPPCTFDLRQRRGHQGDEDVHARSRACPSIVRGFGVVERWYRNLKRTSRRNLV